MMSIRRRKKKRSSCSICLYILSLHGGTADIILNLSILFLMSSVHLMSLRAMKLNLVIVDILVRM
jgi:hypothetical protein